ncbi:MAG: hypothetical protein ACI4FY_01695 [Acetatifactor sp.]
MLQQNLSNYFVIAATAVGVFSIFVTWIILWEAKRGASVEECTVFKKYVNYPFAFSILMLVIQWLTTDGLEEMILKCFMGLTAGWIVSAFLTLLFSAVVKGNAANRKSMRKVILPCIFRVMIMVVTLWLVY